MPFLINSLPLTLYWNTSLRVDYYAVTGACPWDLKLQLHEQFFCLRWSCDFFTIVASPAHSKNRMCSPPCTGDATAEKIARITIS